MTGRVYGEAFAVIPESVLYGEVSVNAKVLYAIFSRHADPEGRCYPGRKRLAELMRVSEDTIKRAKKELLDAELITCEERFDLDGRRTTDDVILHHARCTGAPDPRCTGAPTRTRATLNERTTTRPGGKNAPGAGDTERTTAELHDGFWKAGMNGSQKLTDDERANGLARIQAFREGH